MNVYFQFREDKNCHGNQSKLGTGAFCDDVCYSLAGMSVAIRIDGIAHAHISITVGDEFGKALINRLLIGPDQF